MPKCSADQSHESRTLEKNSLRLWNFNLKKMNVPDTGDKTKKKKEVKKYNVLES